MKVPPRPMPISMKDQGFYDEHSQSQLAIINMTLPYIHDAALSVSLPQEQLPFVIVDYGCSEGKNSVHAVKEIMDSIGRRQKKQLFSVVFNDLPQNNFNKLFENVHSDGIGLDSAFTFACAKPFHTQVVPNQSVNFGYSSSAAHWLTELPDKAIKEHIYLAGASKDESKKLAEVAAKDWQNFLESRAAEMVSGAKLIVTMAGRFTGQEKHNSYLYGFDDDEAKVFTSLKGPTELYSAQTMLDLINKVVQQLIPEKKISQAQFENLCFPVYARTIDELIAPLEKSSLKTKFAIDCAEIVRVACPFFKEYLQTNDGEKYGRLLAQLYRAFMETFMLHQLFGITERRRARRAYSTEQKIIEELFSRVEAAVSAEPDYYTFFPIHSVLVLTRK